MILKSLVQCFSFVSRQTVEHGFHIHVAVPTELFGKRDLRVQ